MAQCPRCRSQQQPTNLRCDQCGTPLPGGAVPGGAGVAPGEVVLTVGRGDGCDPRMPEHARQVSGQHARVYVRGHELAIEDLGSANGTKINGRPLPKFARTPFQLTDQVYFGTYAFNTALLQPHMGSAPQAPAWQPPPAAAAQPYIGQPGAGQPRRAMGRPTFLDRAFSDEGSWMPTFLLIFGIILIALFFLPMGADGKRVMTAMSALGKSSVSGWLKLMLVMMPLSGVALIVLRASKAGKTTVGATLLVCVLPAIGIVPLVGGMAATKAIAASTWIFVFRWFFLSGTAAAMVYISSRPSDGLGRTLLGVFAPMLALSYFFPVDVGNESTILIAVAIKALERGGAPVVVAVVLNLLPLVFALGFMAFLSPQIARRNREAAQHLALLLALLPALSWLLLFLFGAIDRNEPGLMLTAVWTALFASYFHLFPVMGTTLLLLGVRSRSAAYR